MTNVHKTMPVTPHITVRDGEAALKFYAKAFGAKEIYRALADDKKRLMHAAIELNGGGIVMLNDDFPEFKGGKKGTPEAFGGTATTLHLEQKRAGEVDALFERAVKAGASPKMAPADMFWGDRYAVVLDPFGHQWSIAAPASAK